MLEKSVSFMVLVSLFLTRCCCAAVNVVGSLVCLLSNAFAASLIPQPRHEHIVQQQP